LTGLCTNFTETVNAGPGSDDPKLWFKKIEQVNKKVKKAGRQLKEDVELIALTTVPFKASDLYKVKVDAIKASLKGKPTYDELQEYYRDYWFSEVREEEDVLNEAHFLKKYGFRYHKNACHTCGAMGHKKANCPERKDDGNHKPPPYKKRLEGNNFKINYEGNNKKPYKKKNIEDVQCYNCQGKGHYARDCPQKQKFENLFVGCVQTAPKVTVSWDICERHKHEHCPGNCVWQSNAGYLSSDSEEMETDENVLCVGECRTCKENEEVNEQWGTGETVPTKTELESKMEEKNEEGYDMFEDASSENENEAEEAVYEVKNNDYVNFYETALREKENEKEMRNKRKNECLVTMHGEMHSYLREVAYELSHAHDDKNWVGMVKAKLVLMKVFEIKTTLINIRKYNPMLTREGRLMFFKITSRRLIEIGIERIADEDNYGDLNELIEKVSSTRAQNGTPREKRRWIDYLRVRFCAIGINTIRTLLVNILDVNELLGQAREVEFYHRTLDCFMEEGVEILMRDQRNRIIVSADDVTSKENHVHMVLDGNGSNKSSESSNSGS
jgi:hypothetical protein